MRCAGGHGGGIVVGTQERGNGKPSTSHRKVRRGGDVSGRRLRDKGVRDGRAVEEDRLSQAQRPAGQSPGGHDLLVRPGSHHRHRSNNAIIQIDSTIASIRDRCPLAARISSTTQTLAQHKFNQSLQPVMFVRSGNPLRLNEYTNN